MPTDPQRTALVAYLKDRDDLYFGKLLELRQAVTDWLSYIPQTFPHYTRHTVQHSDEIMLQISKMLFRDDDPQQPIVKLSASEAYILGAAAYLHDAGMFVPDGKKTQILESEAWKGWTTGEGDGAKRWREVRALRQSQEPADESVRNFLADIQTRFLIAEFVRFTHHQRAADIITEHQGMLGRFAFDDPMLLRTIADVCVAHGLKQHELEDRERYPERRDIRGQQVNVRFLAILLRLGDLLDVSYDRACPLLLNAASPLPAESLAHWTQYRRIVHRLTSPDVIEITADCQTQEEHRFLQDWCQWMTDEATQAAIIMARTTRHRDWQAPRVSLDKDGGTIKIRPAADATYIPSKWTFELDHEAVVERLINDVYDHPAVYIRELLQNALDANRCQMYADLVKDGLEAPEYPTQVEEERRRRYPVKVSLKTQRVENPLSGELEKRQILTVEDCGIGMDREIIQRYFLQVGRSYYTTDEFRRNFRFVPTSRFGLGFLSVFAVSDRVMVETYKPSSQSQDGPVRLTLTGPRNYLLTDCGERRRSGTLIEVLLREHMAPGELTDLVSGWCCRVEFPLFINDLGTETKVISERPEDFTYEISVVNTDGTRFVVRAFPTNQPGIDGELYVFALVDEQGERWDAWSWARYSYPRRHPGAFKPDFPHDLVCLHGIAMEQSSGLQEGPMAARLDFRGEAHRPTLSRQTSWGRHISSVRQYSELTPRWEEILKEHLATSPNAKSDEGWKYKQKLVEDFPLRSFWASVPETIRVTVKDEQKLMSLEALQAAREIATMIPAHRFIVPTTPYRDEEREGIEESDLSWPSDTLALFEGDLEILSTGHRSAIFENRSIRLAEWSPEGNLVLNWVSNSKGNKLSRHRWSTPLEVTTWPGCTVIGFRVHRTTHQVYGHGLLNEGHPFVRWLVQVKVCCKRNAHGLTEEQFEQLVSLLETPLEHGGYEVSALNAYLQGWKNLPSLPPELHPPMPRLTRDMFRMRKEAGDDHSQRT